MEDLYIYTKKNSLPNELCDEIIDFYNDEGNNRYEGVTQSGLNKNIKDTLDFCIPTNVSNENNWHKINDILSRELYDNLKIYVKNIENSFNISQNSDYKIFDINYFKENTFMIQKYKKQKGKYIYHNDFSIDDKGYRVITYLWYLNDVEEGGETEFWNDFKIKPEKGKLLLFPAHYAFPHCGKMPISSDKIIITGWLYK
jgi:hypothetical protein